MSGKEEIELSFIRCKSCRSLIVSTAEKCRICNKDVNGTADSTSFSARIKKDPSSLSLSGPEGQVVPKATSAEGASATGAASTPSSAAPEATPVAGASPATPEVSSSTTAESISKKTTSRSKVSSVGSRMAESKALELKLNKMIAQLEAKAKSEILSVIAGQIRRVPFARIPSSPTDYWVEQAVWRQLCLTIDMGSNSLLVGPAGTGKTELVIKAAELMNRPLYIFSCGSMSEPRSSLIGATHFDPKKGTYFVESRFVNAIQQPNAVILLDELNRCDPDTYNIFLPLLDGQRVLPLDEDLKGRVCKVADGVVFLGTANIGVEYAGTRRFDRALQDRFSQVLQIRFPPQFAETALLVARFRIDNKVAGTLTRIATQQRSQYQKGEYEFPISTRMLLATAKQIGFGITPREAIEFTLTSHFSSAGGDLSDNARFRQLVQRFLP